MTLRVFISLIFTAFILPVSLWADSARDGFGESSQIESKFFKVSYKPDVSLEGLVTQLNVSKSDEILANLSVDNSSTSKQLATMLDVLFNRASDVLDMHIYSFKGEIKVFATRQELTDFYNNLFHTALPCTGYAFYLADYNSIYVSAEYFRREVIGHEIGHAVMSNYFVVQPSVKIQEVLAGYVEYQLKKSK